MRTPALAILCIFLALLILAATPCLGGDHRRDFPTMSRWGPPSDSLPAHRPLDDEDEDEDGDDECSDELPLPVDDDAFYQPTDAQIELGRFLFFDKILSGNLNTSCATCHHPLADTGDGLSLSVGEGGRGLGVMRDTGEANGTPIHERVPRNAPHLFNLGAREFRTMFHDGRAQENPDHPSGFDSPAGLDLPPGLENTLAVQAMFPVTSMTEMAGQYPENLVANAATDGNLADPGGVWELLAQRLRENPEYVGLFEEAYGVSEEDITFVLAANAIAAYEGTAWRADNSPFDRYLRGETTAMSPSARAGMDVFYRKANCDMCHSGPFLTDHDFHAVAMPQVGPGKGDGFDGHEDFGRERVTGDAADRYKFRTPTLRNVALTGPWGHDGAYNTLEAAARHLVDFDDSVENYDPDQLALPSRRDLDAQDFLVLNDPVRMQAIKDACELPSVELTEPEFRQLMDFLYALTDPTSIDLRDDMPDRVPSGLSLIE